MKKLLLVTILALLFLFVVGCCERQQPDGTVTKSVSNCFLAASDIICHPPEAVVTAANMASPIIAMILNQAVPGSELWINAANAQSVVNGILSTGCVGTEQLAQFIAFIESQVFKDATAKFAAKSMTAKREISAQPFIDWMGKKGK